MDDNISTNELRFAAVKNEATRQRWELFHRAINLAKQSNAEAMGEAEKPQQVGTPDAPDTGRHRAEPLLSIAR